MSVSFKTASSRKRAERASKLIAATAVVLSLSGAAAGADLYWDTNAATAGASGTTTASGTWDGTNNFWNTTSGGGAGTFSATVGSANVAVFSAGTNATGASTITIGGTQEAGGIKFEEGTYTFSGGTGLTLSGAAPTISMTPTGAATAVFTFSTPITATNQVAVSKITGGANTANAVTLRLTTANTFSGGLALSNALRIDANVNGALGSGEIVVTGDGASLSNQNIGTPNLSFANNITLNSGVNAFAVGAAAGTIEYTGIIAGGNGATEMIISTLSSTINSNGGAVTVLNPTAGPNTYSGNTVINTAATGVLKLGSANALPSASGIVFGRNHGSSGNSVGSIDLNGNNISIRSLETKLGNAANTAAGITNSNGGAGGTITLTGSSNTTYSSIIGTVSNANVAGTNNLALTLDAAHTGQLTLTGTNTYTGATTINGGKLILGNNSATNNTIAGNVTINSGGTLSTGSGSMTGNNYGVGGTITVENGGELAVSDTPNNPATLRAGNLAINGGGKLALTLNGLTNYDRINVAGTLTLDSGSHVIDFNGLTAASAGNYTLLTYGNLVSDGTNHFTVGNKIANHNYSYGLNTGSTSTVLTLTPLSELLVWDTDGTGGTPIGEGAGTWSDGSTNTFTEVSANTGATFSNAATTDVQFGYDNTGSGGLITLGTNIVTGGKLIFGPISSTAPYTLGASGATETLTTKAGIVANSSGSVIDAPVVVDGSQAYNVANSASVTVNGSITEAASGTTLTKDGGGALTIPGNVTVTNYVNTSGTTNFSGTNTVSSITATGGTVRFGSAAATGGASFTLSNNATLRVDAPMTLTNNITVGTGGGTFNVVAAADNSSFAGNITGTGNIIKAGAGKLTLTGTNTFNGIQIIDNSTLAATSDAALGSGTVAINGGNIFQAAASFTTDNNFSTGASGTSHIDTQGFDLVLTGTISGTGSALGKRGTGKLTISNNSTYTGNTVFIAGMGGGTIETQALNALGVGGNLQVLANGTLQTTSDLNAGAIRGTSVLTKTGAGTLNLSGSTTTANNGGGIVVEQGMVVMNSREALGGVNPTTTVTQAQMNITLNSGTELVTNWGSITPRYGGSITLAGGTITRPSGLTADTLFSSYNGATNFGGFMLVTGNSLIRTQQIATGATTNQNMAFTMPMQVSAGATLTLQNDNNGGYSESHLLAIRADNSVANDGFLIEAGGTVAMAGPGHKRFGQRVNNGKRIVGQGNSTVDAVMKLDSNTSMTDAGSSVTRLIVNGSGTGGLRVEAPMNATYTDRSVNADPTVADATTGLFGVNNTNTQEGGTATTGFNVIGNAYTVLSPKRADVLSETVGSITPAGTLTVAATDAGGATGLVNVGPSTPGNVTLALDNTATSGNLVYQLAPAAASGGKLNNFAGLHVKRSNTGAGSVTAKMVPDGMADGVLRANTLTIDATARLDLSDNKVITKSARGSLTPNNPGDPNEGGVYSGVQGLVQKGYNEGAWNGFGIVTSQGAALDGLTTIGVAKVEDVKFIGATETMMWGGQTVTGADTLVMYTYGGDADLNGKLDADDYSFIDVGIGSAGATGYSNGDFNYDGVINADDYSVIDTNINSTAYKNAGPIWSGEEERGFAAASSGLTAVPEPASLGVIAAAGAGLLLRRRRAR